nr:hypothetical protein [uncultured Mogibacterium sp.]
MVTKKKGPKAKISGIMLTAILILTMMPWHVMAEEASPAEGTAATNAVTNESEVVSKETANAATEANAQEKPAATLASEKPAAITPKASKKLVTTSVKVVYKDGTPVEDGTVFTLEDPDNNEQKDYEVKNGKLELKLISDKQYRLGLSWDDEKMDTHKVVEADANLGTIPVGISAEGKSLVWYDRHNKKLLEDKPVTTVTLKETEDDATPSEPKPVEKKRVEKGELANVRDIEVVLDDGTPMPDGVQLELIDMSRVADWSYEFEKFTVKGGKIHGVKMKAETQYKIGMDTANPSYSDYTIVGAYNSKHLMRIYARYENEYPLYYDYDEGTGAPEKPIAKLVFHKVKEQSELENPKSNSNITVLKVSDGGYVAKAGLPFRLVRKDNGKSKVIYSEQGEVTINTEGNVPYELKLDENDTYVMKNKIEFTMKPNKQGKYNPIIEGYDANDINGYLQCSAIELVRKDGKKPGSDIVKPGDNTGDNSGDDCNTCGPCEDCAQYKPEQYAKIYEKEKVILKNMPVLRKSGNEYKPVKKKVTFIFYNATTQTVETKVQSSDGVLPDVEMVKGHNYIVFAEDGDFEMPNAYLVLNKTGEKPVPSKQNGRKVDAFYLTLRQMYVSNPEVAKRVAYTLPVFDKDHNPVDNVKIKFVSEYDQVTATVNDGVVEYALIEDQNYMVYVDDPRYTLDSFPMTMKDKSEWGAAKYAFNHFSCGSVNELILKPKSEEGKSNTQLIDIDNTTAVTGLHFGRGDYLVSVRKLPKESVKGLEGKDYEVIDIDMINMYRTELSKLVRGNFKVSRLVPDGKDVKQVYYVDKDGKLVKVPFKQILASDGGYIVAFDMSSMSMYNNVIEYTEHKPAEPEKPVTPAEPEKPVNPVNPGNNQGDNNNSNTQPSVPNPSNSGDVTNSASEYYVANGNLVWNNEDNGLLIVVKSKTDDEKTFERFRGVEVDGNVVDPSNYDVVKGSARVTLHASYLKSLKPGKHAVTVRFNNGSLNSEFTVASHAAKKAPNGKIVKTGDSMGFEFMFAFVIANLLLGVVIAMRKKSA